MQAPEEKNVKLTPEEIRLLVSVLGGVEYRNSQSELLRFQVVRKLEVHDHAAA